MERSLLARENLQMTVRLLLMNAFDDTDPKLTRIFAELYDLCPELFEHLLPRSEIDNLGVVFDIDEEVSLRGDDDHLRPVVIGCVKSNYVRKTLRFPIVQSQMDAAFENAFRMCYDQHYGLKYITHFGKVPLQWCRKLAFYDT